MPAHRRLASAAALVALTGSALAAHAAGSPVGSTATAAPRGWAATRTQAIALRAPRLGAAAADRRVEISVSLPLRDRAAMTRLIVAQTTPGTADYQRLLTPAQVLARFGPTDAQVAAVRGYLTAAGMQRVTVEPNHLLVDASATVAQAERAFHTTLVDYRVRGRRVTVNTTPALVPARLAGDVLAVLGLSGMPMTLPLRPRPAAATAAPTAVRATAGVPGVVHTPGGVLPYNLNGFGPAAVAHAYDADRLPRATRTSVAIVMGGDPAPVLRDLRNAERYFHFPAVPVSVAYTARPELSTVDNGPLTGSLEWSLDSQISTMVAGAVKNLVMYDIGTFTDPEVARAINAFVAQDRALNLSASLGECDYIAFLDGAMVTTDESLAEGSLQGQSAFASTGDNGFACPEVVSTGAPEGPPGVSWPSDGEFTTAVGGTTLLADSAGTVSREVAWVATGGGVSPYATAAPWTLRANPAGQSWQETNQGGRGVPDVAALADGNTPYLVYTGTGTTGVGGTSVSAPLVMGLWSRVQNARGGRLGLAAADFYRLYNAVNPGTLVNPLLAVYAPAANPAPVAGFRDVTLGSNGVYPALPGYDFTTGIGALDAGVLTHRL